MAVPFNKTATVRIVMVNSLGLSQGDYITNPLLSICAFCTVSK